MKRCVRSCACAYPTLIAELELEDPPEFSMFLRISATQFEETFFGDFRRDLFGFRGIGLVVLPFFPQRPANFAAVFRRRLLPLFMGLLAA